MAGIITIRGTENNGARTENEIEAVNEATGFEISAKIMELNGMIIMTGISGMVETIEMAAVIGIVTIIIGSGVMTDDDFNAEKISNYVQNFKLNYSQLFSSDNFMNVPVKTTGTKATTYIQPFVFMKFVFIRIEKNEIKE